MPNYTPAYTDLDPMPYGKYKGTVLQDVPASYLAWMKDTIQVECDLWIRTRDECKWIPREKERIKLYNYIRNSWDAI